MSILAHARYNDRLLRQSRDRQGAVARTKQSRDREGAVALRLVAALCVSLIAAGVALAAEPIITREGEWWVATVTGAEAVPGAVSLRLTGRGHVTLTGDPAPRVSWEIKTRVKAPDMASARARLGSSAVRVSQRDGDIHVLFQPASGETAARLALPRSLRTVRVALSDGGVEAYGIEGAVSVTTGGGAVKADRIGGDFVARTGGGSIDLGAINGAARCSTGGGVVRARLVRGEAVLETGAGDITADQMFAAVRAMTGGGAVRIARAGAGVIVNNGGGPIDIGEARGLVEVRNSGGPVHVGSAAGVRCEAAAGAIRLVNVSGSLRASTAIGSILAQFANQAIADSFLTTGRGDITVIIPSNLSVKIRAENEMPGGERRIVSDFPGILTRVAGGQLVAEGDINGGGPLLRICGTGGTIFIKRR